MLETIVVIEVAALPLSNGYRTLLGTDDWQLALTGGEDYELLFSAPVDARSEISDVAAQSGCPITRIGSLGPHAEGVRVTLADNVRSATEFTGFDHFARKLS